MKVNVKVRQHVPFSENSLATFTSECSDHQWASKLVCTCQPIHAYRTLTNGASGSLMRVPSEFPEFGFDPARTKWSGKSTRTYKEQDEHTLLDDVAVSSRAPFCALRHERVATSSTCRRPVVRIDQRMLPVAQRLIAVFT
jgi:hypothetical protein